MENLMKMLFQIVASFVIDAVAKANLVNISFVDEL